MELGDFFLDKPEKIRYTREAVKGKALIGGSPVKLEELELSLLFDYYGELLTEKQRTCFELYYNQDFSLGENAGEAANSRQAVYDTLARAESALRTMEGRVGAVARDLACRKALARIRQAAETLAQSEDPVTAGLAGEILEAAATMKE